MYRRYRIDRNLPIDNWSWSRSYIGDGPLMILSENWYRLYGHRRPMAFEGETPASGEDKGRLNGRRH